jgi:hypothetical protein
MACRVNKQLPPRGAEQKRTTKETSSVAAESKTGKPPVAAVSKTESLSGVAESKAEPPSAAAASKTGKPPVATAPKAEPPSAVAAEDEEETPYGLYLPGKIYGRQLHLLVDTGCTRSILSKTFFDRLPTVVRRQLRPGIRSATLADGSSVKMYGQITLPTRIRHLKQNVTYQVLRSEHDGILGVDFLSNGCMVDVGAYSVHVNGKKMACTDRFGEMLTAKVQVLRTVMIPAKSEVSVTCRLTNPVSGGQGLVEDASSDAMIGVAACLVKPDSRRCLPVLLLN